MTAPFARLLVSSLTWALAWALAAHAAPRRIVSTSPSITEILFALGLGDRVAGVTTHCRYPDEARVKPKIGSFVQPNLEAIAALQPDLVVIQKNPIDLAGRLARLKLVPLEVDYGSVEEVLSAIGSIATAAGEPKAGQALAARLRDELNEVRNRTRGRAPRTVAIIVGRNPGRIEGLFAVGPRSYLSGLIAAAGGRNVFDDAPGSYPQVSAEALVARNPEVIVDLGGMMGGRDQANERKRAVLEEWRSFSVLRAVREQGVHAASDDFFMVPGPRMTQAARALALILHPETTR